MYGINNRRDYAKLSAVTSVRFWTIGRYGQEDHDQSDVVSDPDHLALVCELTSEWHIHMMYVPRKDGHISVFGVRGKSVQRNA